MRSLSLILLCGALGLSLAAHADKTDKPAKAAKAAESKLDMKAAEESMKKSDCFTCHQVKNKVVGPAYKDVAKKYRKDKGAVAKLVKKVKEGGSGVWGQIPMAPHANLTDAEIEPMVRWVLAQK